MTAEQKTERTAPPEKSPEPIPASVPDTGPSPNSDRNLQMMLDVPLTFSAELGTCNLTVKEVLNLSRGKVVELEKLAGEPLDVLLNGRLIAHAEAVVVNDRFGVRIIDIASPTERMNRMRA